MDTIQLILIFVIVSLTSLLFIIGVQVILILRDLRKMLGKADSSLSKWIHEFLLRFRKK